MLITWSYLDLFLVNKQQVKAAVFAAADPGLVDKQQVKAAADPELAVSDPGFGSEY